MYGLGALDGNGWRRNQLHGGHGVLVDEPLSFEPTEEAPQSLIVVPARTVGSLDVAEGAVPLGNDGGGGDEVVEEGLEVPLRDEVWSLYGGDVMGPTGECLCVVEVVFDGFRFDLGLEFVLEALK